MFLQSFPCRATPGTPASTISKFFKFQNHCEHVHNKLWKFHRNRVNVVQYAHGWATSGTPASVIFFSFSKPLRACLQQLVKILLQSDEQCVLLVEQHRVIQLVNFFLIFIKIYNRLYRLILNIGIISIKAYSLYCHPGSNLKLFNHVRYIK